MSGRAGGPPCDGDHLDSDSNPTSAARPEKRRIPFDRLGDFEVLHEIGRGGMGIVYEARQLSLDRRVALKVLTASLGPTPQAVRRFEREARAAAKVHHTNIVPVYAIGEDRGLHYYAMELIEGRSLSAVIRDLSGLRPDPLEVDATPTILENDRATSPSSSDCGVPGMERLDTGTLSDSSAGGRRWFDRVAKLVADAADALEYAHARGVIHRDIKPANLILSKDGRLYITDFGLARVVHEPGLTITGSLMGTPAYMSPEQITSERVEVDHRTDIYSLGTVLYELLTRRRPFSGRSREEILCAILTKDPPPPRRLDPRIPIDLDTICQKAMEKDPARRYQSAGRFAEDLRHFLAHDLISARRTGWFRRFWKTARRHPTSAAAVGVAMAAALAISGVVAVYARRSTASEVERLILDGQLAWETSAYEQSLLRAEAALELDPNNFAARLLRAKARAQTDTIRDVVREARQRLADDPSDWISHLVLAYAATGSYPDLSIDLKGEIRALERLAPETTDAYFVRAGIAKDPKKRLQLLDRSLELDPTNAMALVGRINVSLFFLKDFQTALQDSERLIAVRPRSPQGHRMKAYVLDTLHDNRAAFASIERAIAMTDDDRQPVEAAWNYRTRAIFQKARRETEAAIADCSRAIDLDPDILYAWVERATCYSHLGEYEKALDDSRRSVEINPDYSPGWFSLFSAYWHLRRGDDLRAALLELETRADSWWDLKQRAQVDQVLARYYRYLGFPETALAYAEKSIALDPDCIEGHAQLIQALRLLKGDRGTEQECDRLAGLTLDNLADDLKRARYLDSLCHRSDAAIEGLSRLLGQAPRWAEPYLYRGALHHGRGDYLAAVEDFNRAIESAPTWTLAYRYRAHAYRRDRRYDEALADIARVISLEPKNASAFYARSAIHNDMERFEEALSDLTRYFELGSRGYNARWQQAVALLRLGREEEALAAVDRAVNSHPQLEIPIERRVEILMKMGRVDDAFESAERAVRLFPKSASCRLRRAEAALFGGRNCAEVVSDIESALKLAPGDAMIASRAAGVYGLLYERCPERFEAESALAMAEVAAAKEAKQPLGHRLVGMALYRLDRFQEAKEALDWASARETPTPDPQTLFFLAMTEWNLGHRDRAERRYDAAVARMNATFPRHPALLMLQAEAAELLGYRDEH